MTTHHQQLCYALLLFIAVPLIDATIPTIDNIVKVLQSPSFQQIVLPQPLIAADPTVMMSDSNKPASASSDTAADKNKPQADASLEAKDENPTLKLVTRVLDTFRAPLPSQQVLLIPQRHRALPGCPLCDASVYSYCDYKVYHDGCCCGTMNGGYGHGFSGVSNGIGYGGCGYQEDCSFLYANSCYEHQLIVNCCCNSPY
ncbi:uncharacterized protein LOC110681489 [Aedes aegypti]|uniref:Uncharacterized protein n=1 Tax=Aedes aegypti TaxID=7159 RepID=A0A6I8U0M0_AEDAE|nr:uncharacterized protein LOC110681489 [Aedes aegypti]